MNKSDLVKALQKDLDLPIRKAEDIVDTMFDQMSRTLVNGDRIEIRGFGSFVKAMPVWLQWISNAIPLTHYLTIIRALLLKGVGVESLQTEIFALIFFGIVLIGAASLRFRKRLD